MRRRQIETALGIFLKKMVPQLTSGVERYTLKPATSFDSAVKERGTVYTFPTLGVCRNDFTEKLQQPITWGDDATEWEVCNV